MTPEHSEALGLEQKCLRPGLWHVEGFEVRRSSYPPRHWMVRPMGKSYIVHISATLRGCQDWIRDNQPREGMVMGAEVFNSIGKGATIQAAFDAAVAEAQYDYGHAGYTGTIAEKTSTVMISEAPMTLYEAEALAEHLLEDEDPRINDKWGPAGAIKLDDGRWYFFGWSSS